MDEQASHPGEHQADPPPPLGKRLITTGQAEELMARVRQQYGVAEGEPVLSSERL